MNNVEFVDEDLQLRPGMRVLVDDVPRVVIATNPLGFDLECNGKSLAVILGSGVRSQYRPVAAWAQVPCWDVEKTVKTNCWPYRCLLPPPSSPP
jgi:hypothetical protein